MENICKLLTSYTEWLFRSKKPSEAMTQRSKTKHDLRVGNRVLSELVSRAFDFRLDRAIGRAINFQKMAIL